MNRTLVVIGLGMFGVVAACAPKHPENPALDEFPRGIAGTTNITYYDIHGRTIPDLVLDMRRLGPKSAEGSFFGETSSPMRWTWRTRTSPAGCEVTDVQVRVETNMILPRWTPPADTAPGVLAQWNAMMASLQTHEIGHKDISARAAKDVQRTLERFSGPCETLAADTRRLTDPIMTRLRVDQVEYDAATQHGRTQGAALSSGRAPPS